MYWRSLKRILGSNPSKASSNRIISVLAASAKIKITWRFIPLEKELILTLGSNAKSLSKEV